MQIDMHYYGTYAMARAAGLSQDVCQIIATCAQYVDDNAVHEKIKFEDGGLLSFVATAHHTLNHRNADEADQRKVWVPFHFLPGNQGDSYFERLKCRKNSVVAQRLVQHMLSRYQSDFAIHSIGIAAHVYADTFSHYDFSGTSAPTNAIKNDSLQFETEPSDEIKQHINLKKIKFHKREIEFEEDEQQVGFWDSMTSIFAEQLSGALGHGAVLTYPDRPYLHWSFEFEDINENNNTGKQIRNNPVTFMEGCEALHKMFCDFAELRPKLTDRDPLPFFEIREKVSEILKTEGTKEQRIDLWQSALKDGFGSLSSEEIPEYLGHQWNENFLSHEDRVNSSSVLLQPAFKFFQAASYHRNYVTRDLLPSVGLVVN